MIQEAKNFRTSPSFKHARPHNIIHLLNIFAGPSCQLFIVPLRRNDQLIIVIFHYGANTSLRYMDYIQEVQPIVLLSKVSLKSAIIFHVLTGAKTEGLHWPPPSLPKELLSRKSPRETLENNSIRSPERNMAVFHLRLSTCHCNHSHSHLERLTNVRVFLLYQQQKTQ